jgi:hypothetical protein
MAQHLTAGEMKCNVVVWLYFKVSPRHAGVQAFYFVTYSITDKI